MTISILLLKWKSKTKANWRRIVMMTSWLILISSILSIGTSAAWLTWGETVGGIAFGAVAGYLVGVAFPQISNRLRRNPTAPGSLDLKFLFDAAVITVLTFTLSALFIALLKPWSLSGIQAYHGVTIVNPVQPGRTVMAGVAKVGSRYVAVGSFRPIGTGDCYLDAALWDSKDGYSWNRLHHDSDLQGDLPLTNGQLAHRIMLGIADTEDGALIVGQDNYPDGQYRGQVWRLRHDQDAVEAAHDMQFPPAMGYNGYAENENVQVLVGFDGVNAIGWTKIGNGVWKPHSFGASRTTAISSVTFTHGKWIAAGIDRSHDPDYSPDRPDKENYFATDGAVWYSSDGVKWEQAAGFAGSPHSQAVNNVVYLHGMWVAVGRDDTSDVRDMDAAVWVSDDLANWSQLDIRSIQGITGYQSMNGAVVTDDGDHVLVVGNEVGAPASPGPTHPDDGSSPAVPDGDPGDRQTPVLNQPIERNAAWQMTLTPRLGSRSVSQAWNNLLAYLTA